MNTFRSANVDDLLPSWYERQPLAFRARVLNMADDEFEDAVADFETDMRDEGIERIYGDIRDCIRACAQREFDPIGEIAISREPML